MPRNILNWKKKELIKDLMYAGYQNIEPHSSNAEILKTLYEYKRMRLPEGLTSKQTKALLRKYLEVHTWN